MYKNHFEADYQYDWIIKKNGGKIEDKGELMQPKVGA